MYIFQDYLVENLYIHFHFRNGPIMWNATIQSIFAEKNLFYEYRFKYGFPFL